MSSRHLVLSCPRVRHVAVVIGAINRIIDCAIEGLGDINLFDVSQTRNGTLTEGTIPLHRCLLCSMLIISLIQDYQEYQHTVI